jgi:hypothetical protein
MNSLPFFPKHMSILTQHTSICCSYIYSSIRIPSRFSSASRSLLEPLLQSNKVPAICISFSFDTKTCSCTWLCRSECLGRSPRSPTL